MAKFLVFGGRTLRGDLRAGGSKNAALPVLFATLLARGRSQIYNLPDILDVRVALRLLASLGAEIVEREGCTEINTENIEYRTPSARLTSRIRASTYLIGSMLSAFGRCEPLRFGGCSFSDRPIDLHIAAAVAFGAEWCSGELTLAKSHPTRHTVGKRSVGATVNSLLLAAATDGESELLGCAEEPHIAVLVDFLSSMGAEISVSGDRIRIKGGRLHGGSVRIHADSIEAATYLIASALTCGAVRASLDSAAELLPLGDALASGGGRLVFSPGSAMLESLPTLPISIETAPYPGFPTDIQPLAAALLSASAGGRIIERVWPSRFGYLDTLSRFGVGYRQYTDSAEIFPSRLHAASVTAPDLRGGAAALIAALAAEGESVIDSAEIIERGYENPVGKLTSLGAKIERIN